MISTIEIIETLKSMGSEERREKSKTMYPTSMIVLGVTNPDLKLVLKDVFENMRQEPGERFIALSLALVNSKIIECQLLAWLLLDKSKLVQTLTREELKAMEGVLDNWGSVDAYGVLLYGILWRQGTVRDDEVFALQNSDNVWYRRLALVAVVALNLKSRGGVGDTARTLKVCKGAVNDSHDMVVKALSWALRSLIRWDKKAVEDFMEQYKDRLKRRVIREVDHKLEFGTKN